MTFPVPPAGAEGFWKTTMTDVLKALIAQAREIRMDEAQQREQRLSFVYGNTHIENERITRDLVAEADKNVDREDDFEVLRML